MERKRKDRYRKPNMCNLRGHTGRAVIEAIRSMEEPDFTDLIRESDECEKKILVSRQNVISKDDEWINETEWDEVFELTDDEKNQFIKNATMDKVKNEHEKWFLDTMQGLLEAVSIKEMKSQQHENECISIQDVQLNLINELFNSNLLNTEQFKILVERIRKQFERKEGK